METVDHMPPQWRALVRYFGFEPVSALYSPGADAATAWGQLEAVKIRRQEQQLATDYFPKTNRGKPP